MAKITQRQTIVNVHLEQTTPDQGCQNSQELDQELAIGQGQVTAILLVLYGEKPTFSNFISSPQKPSATREEHYMTLIYVLTHSDSISN